jgi:aspartokinase
MESAGIEEETWTGFAGKTWQVHKFGGTSVANANCYRKVAEIVEEQLGIVPSDTNESTHISPLHLFVVVSAMGGTPKVTDLLLRSVEEAAARNHSEVGRGSFSWFWKSIQHVSMNSSRAKTEKGSCLW